MVIVLSYLHNKNIVFRDFKSENILIDKDGYLKLIDFQFAKKLKHSNNYLTYTFVGTPQYLCPEMLLNKGYSFASDFWCLGVLIFELYTQKNPFWNQTEIENQNLLILYKNILTKQINWDNEINMHKHTKNLINKLLKKKPQKRLQNKKTIQKHKFFKGIDWDKIENKQVKAPWIPYLQNEYDTAYFTKYNQDMDDNEEPQYHIDVDKKYEYDEKEPDPFKQLFELKTGEPIRIDKNKQIRKKAAKYLKNIKFCPGLIQNGFISYNQFVDLLTEFNLYNDEHNFVTILDEIFYYICTQMKPKRNEYDEIEIDTYWANLNRIIYIADEDGYNILNNMINHCIEDKGYDLDQKLIHKVKDNLQRVYDIIYEPECDSDQSIINDF